MHISLETKEQHAIEAYSDNRIQINSITYERSLIVSKQEIISDLTIKHLAEIDEHYMRLFLSLKPEIIILGHQDTGKFPSPEIAAHLSQQRIGLECMSIGAACRTYNILLSEYRVVVAGFILS